MRNVFFVFSRFLLFVLVLFSVNIFKSNAQQYILSASIGYGSEREMYTSEKEHFKSKNTICLDLGVGYCYDEDYILGIAGGIGFKSFDFAGTSKLYEDMSSRRGKFEVSLGPALYFGGVRDFFHEYHDESPLGLILSAQPSFWVGKLLSSENEVIVGSWGVKLSADLRISYFTMGICYNPFDLKMYKPNTNTNIFSPVYNSKYVYLKPTLEFRIGVILAGDE